MFVKKFEAASLDEALSQVKNTMGPDALILSSRELPGGLFRRGNWEVTAAAEKRRTTSKGESLDEKQLKEIFPHRSDDSVKIAAPSTLRQSQVGRYADLTDDPAMEKPRKPRHVERFLELGFSSETAKDFGYQLQYEYSSQDVDNPRRLDKIQTKLFTSSIKFLKEGIFDSWGDFAVVGPSGSGKTSLLVKWAIGFRRKAKRVRLLSLDDRKLMGKPELEAYAKRLSIPFGVADEMSAEELRLWDTPGLSSTTSVSDLIRMTEGKEVILVLDAGLRLSEMMRWKAKTDEIDVRGVVFTKIDEIKDRGICFDFVKRSNLPVLGASISHSLRTPFKYLEPDSWVRMLMRSQESSDV